MHTTDNRNPRASLRRVKGALFLLALLSCALLLSGCVMNDADIAGSSAAPPAVSVIPQGEAVGEDTAQSSVLSSYVESIAQSDPKKVMTTAAIRLPDSVTVCYDGTYSMMGFVDVHGTNEYTNALTLVNSAVAACFSDVPQQYYRLGRESQPDSLDSRDAASSTAMPSFFLNADMLVQPERVVLSGASSASRGTRMNEPVKSYYHVLGLEQPAETADEPYPASQALELLGDNGFVVLVTDLEELQTNQTLMREIEDKVYANDMIAGVTAVESSFSGFVPVWSKGEPVWFEWGAQPTGSCEIMFDYIDYQLGLTIDPNTRKAENRPFYVLCFGNSESVNAFSLSLGSLLGSKGEKYTMSIFDAAFGPIDYNMADSIDRSRLATSKDGINPMNLDDKQYVSSLQLQGLNKKQAGDDNRWFTVPVTYLPRLSDPRIGQFTAQDFAMEAWLQKQDANGIYGERVKVTDEVATTVDVENRTTGSAVLTVRCAFPQNKLDKGAQYLLTVSLLLNTPQAYNTPDWMATYDQTLDNATILQMTSGETAFDGNRTVGLSTLMGAIVEYQQKTASVLPIGEFGVLLNIAGS